MKLPNGYGSVFKLTGKRRKPYGVRKTVGWDEENGKQLYQNIGYYESRKIALQALAEFNADPYDVRANTITFAEVYEKWSERKFAEISKSNINGYKASWKLCEKIQNMKFVEVKLDHLQMVVDESGKNFPTLRKLKVLFGQLYDYAVIHEIVSKERHVVEYVDISRAGNPNKYDRKPFTKNEVEKVWGSVNASEYMQIILMLIYTGVRISELLDLKKENINLEEKWFDVIDSKTIAGIRRVPIANKIYAYFERWMQKNDCEYLLSTPDGDHFEYRNYYDSYWTPLIEQMGMSHTPHDTRHTCISLLTVAGVSDKIIKKIVGHKGQSVTEIVYTHFEIKELIDAINLI